MENLLRKLISNTVAEADQGDFFAELDGDVKRDNKGVLRASNGNRVVYDANGERTEFDAEGTAVATSAEGGIPDEPAAGTVTDTPQVLPDNPDLASQARDRDERDTQAGADAAARGEAIDTSTIAAEGEGDGFVEAEPYDTWKVTELKDELDARDIAYGSKDTKDELVQLLEDHDAEEAE